MAPPVGSFGARIQLAFLLGITTRSNMAVLRGVKNAGFPTGPIFETGDCGFRHVESMLFCCAASLSGRSLLVLPQPSSNIRNFDVVPSVEGLSPVP